VNVESEVLEVVARWSVIGIAAIFTGACYRSIVYGTVTIGRHVQNCHRCIDNDSNHIEYSGQIAQLYSPHHPTVRGRAMIISPNQLDRSGELIRRRL